MTPQDVDESKVGDDRPAAGSTGGPVCPHCGSDRSLRIQQSPERFCVECGTRFVPQANAAPGVAPPAPPAAPATSVASAAPAPEPAPAVPKAKPPRSRVPRTPAERRRRWLIGVIGLAVLALVGALAYWYFVATVAVPDLAGLTREQAASALADAGLSAAGVRFDTTATGPRGTVAAQDPTPGTHVYRSGAVSLTLVGPEMLEVPDLAGMDEVTARGEIESAGFAVGDVSSAFHDTVAVGQVVAQKPAAGAQAPRDSHVLLTISLGKDLRTVPDVVGSTQAAAEETLAGAGLVAQIKTSQSPTVAKGAVISQSLAAGTSVDPGTTIVLTVSTGAPAPKPAPVEKVRVPSVVGLKQATAEGRIRSAGLVPRDVWPYGNDPGGFFREYCYVTSQRPAAGSMVTKGSVVTISIVWE